jgi:hypothetical protein
MRLTLLQVNIDLTGHELKFVVAMFDEEKKGDKLPPNFDMPSG